MTINESNKTKSCPSKYSATASASGSVSISCGKVVTATATASAIGRTHEESYKNALKEAERLAHITAQNDANIISQTIDIIESRFFKGKGKGKGRAKCNGILPNENTSYGYESLYSLQCQGANNSAFGYQTLYANTNGSDNNAFGYRALYNNILGVENNAFGTEALYSNTSGSENVAVGSTALYSNTIGINNVAFGNGALYNNTTGNYNTALGDIALYENTTGTNNCAVGEGALLSNTSGSNNTVLGTQAFETNLTGANNTVIGYLGGVGSGGPNGYYDNKCTLIGGETSFSQTRTSSNDTFECSTAIGYGSVIEDSHTIYLGTLAEKTVAVGGLETPNAVINNQFINSACPTIITDTIALNYPCYTSYTVSALHDSPTITLPTADVSNLGMQILFINFQAKNCFTIHGNGNIIFASDGTTYCDTLAVSAMTPNVLLYFMPIPPTTLSGSNRTYAWFQV